jgi:hypothetical protein
MTKGGINLVQGRRSLKVREFYREHRKLRWDVFIVDGERVRDMHQRGAYLASFITKFISFQCDSVFVVVGSIVVSPISNVAEDEEAYPQENLISPVDNLISVEATIARLSAFYSYSSDNSPFLN